MVIVAFFFTGGEEPEEAQTVSLIKAFQINPDTRGLRLFYPYIALYIHA